MIKEFLLRKMMDKQMKDVPEADKEKMLGLFMKHPDFFKQIAFEVKAEMDAGKEQMQAVMDVMMRHQQEAERIFKENDVSQK